MTPTLVQAPDLTPNIGLAWYLLATAFPATLTACRIALFVVPWLASLPLCAASAGHVFHGRTLQCHDCPALKLCLLTAAQAAGKCPGWLACPCEQLPNLAIVCSPAAALLGWPCSAQRDSTSLSFSADCNQPQQRPAWPASPCKQLLACCSVQLPLLVLLACSCTPSGEPAAL